MQNMTNQITKGFQAKTLLYSNSALETKYLLVQFRDKMELPEKHNIQIQYIA